MDELSTFCNELKGIMGNSTELSIEKARKIVQSLNEFLYARYPDIGTTNVLDAAYDYISDFHKYWERHYKEILNVRIDDSNCEKVADALHLVFQKTNGHAFSQVWDTCGLRPEDVCRVRLFTANQDFRGSRAFSELAEIFRDDDTIFDEDKIIRDPAGFINDLGLSDLSQNDKRETYALKIAEFVKARNVSPYELISCFNNNVYDLRNALINCVSSGYGNKKADMFVRDMVVLNIWTNVVGFEKIDVASDVNTIKVALKTGVLKTSIPLVSSFLDIFCYQYGYMDEMNAKAWRRVWEIWNEKFPTECVQSPCLMDYFVYEVIGKQFCKESLAVYKCDTYDHSFKWHSARISTCRICHKEGRKGFTATCIKKVMPCCDPDGAIAILQSKYVLKLPQNEKMEECPFKNVCDSNNARNLQPPKSISILGQTGWTTAYSNKGCGGGGLMA
ncbi:hypothetical protein SAMN05720761_1455 [Fibrobacter sp. UWCM]|uniref:hypothetical protein n=1 Tax=Fibrobacter sp. UWCM TaxID=1896208 RepID=UPI0009232F17|nr:hypothetical protein [Fibrobacter sp. UWCM]SHH92068.1 hypothetical protein SAMN05720761_1455 [Fibrobacter sp. UWCM]